MYPVDLSICLYEKSGAHATLERTIELPFPPYPGMHIAGLTIEPMQPEEVEFVCWRRDAGRFEVQLADWNFPNTSLQDMLADFGPEWKKYEPPPDEDEPTVLHIPSENS